MGWLDIIRVSLSQDLQLICYILAVRTFSTGHCSYSSGQCVMFLVRILNYILFYDVKLSPVRIPLRAFSFYILYEIVKFICLRVHDTSHLFNQRMSHQEVLEHEKEVLSGIKTFTQVKSEIRALLLQRPFDLNLVQL